MAHEKKFVRHVRIGITPELDEMLKRYLDASTLKETTEPRELRFMVFEALSALLDERDAGYGADALMSRLSVVEGQSRWSEHLNREALASMWLRRAEEAAKAMSD